ncbi:retrovirus-related pol polyprotein from transposon TNT 1-94 [Tanacetum coccineum]
MLNKDNYVIWSSCLLRHAKSKPNGKLIYNSIMNGPYVRRMIPEPGDPDREVPVAETFHEQTDDKLTEKEGKQMKADDQVIQIILIANDERSTITGYLNANHKLNIQLHPTNQHSTCIHVTTNAHNPEDITDPTTAMNMTLVLMAKIASGEMVRNLNGVNAVQECLGYSAVQYASSVSGCSESARADGNANRNNDNQIRYYNYKGLGHLARNCTAKPRKKDAAYLQTQLLIAQKEETVIQLQAKEFNFMAAAEDLDEIEEVNANCILMANLQQASTSNTQTGKAPAYDRKSEASHKFRLEVLGNRRFRNDHVAVILGYDLEVAFRRNTCFVRNLKGVDLLKGNRTTNFYTINLYKMASGSPIFLMACATSTKSWLWHQRLSHLNFDTINDLDKNDLVTGLPKFKYHKEHLCPSCEQGKSKKASHPPKPVPNSKQRLHLLHMDLCGPMRVESINGKRYVLVIVDDYSGYTWVHFLRSKNKAPEEITFFMKKITVLLEAPVIIDIGKLGAKGDIGFFIGYSANSRAYRVYNQRTKKIMETMNVTFDELSAMAFEQSSSKIGLQGMTSRQISSGLDLTYAPSTITTQKPTERELDLLFKAMYDDYIAGQSSATPRTTLAAQAPKVLQTPTTSTTTADTAPTPKNSSFQDANTLNTSQDVDELEPRQQHVHQQENQVPLQTETVADNVPNAMLDGNTFVNTFAPSSTSAAESSSSQYVDPSNMHTFINLTLTNICELRITP